MPVLADIKVMPEHLDVVYQKLRQALSETESYS
jgi:translation elongation factor EF-1beta